MRRLLAPTLVVLAAAAGLAVVGLIPRLPATSAYAATLESQFPEVVSSIVVQNQDPSTPANVSIDFYDLNGNLVYTLPTVQVVTQRSWYIPSHIPALPSGFAGSAVVNSDRPVSATFNTQTPSEKGKNPADPYRAASSRGVATPATEAFLPQLLKNYSADGVWGSSFFVQNAGTTDATVTVKYFRRSDGAQVTSETATVKPNTTLPFHLSQKSGLGSSFFGSAYVQSDKAVAVVANFFNDGTSEGKSQFQGYNAFASGAKKLYVPRLAKMYPGPRGGHYNSGISIQNVSTSPATVNVTYFFPGAQRSETLYIQPYQAAAYYLASTSWGLYGLLPNGAFGSAVITSDQNVVAVVNEDNRTVGHGDTYAAFIDGQQTATVFYPQFVSRYYGYASGMQVQNAGTEGTNVTVNFAASNSAVNVNYEFWLGPNEARSIFGPDRVAANDFTGSATVTASQPLFGIANMAHRSDKDPRYPMGSAGSYGDSFSMYNGINQ